MNLDVIKQIVTGSYSDREKRALILQTLSEDESVIPDLLDILAFERKGRKELIQELNFQLSRAHTIIIAPELNKDKFVHKEIVDFYKKNKDKASHCFKITELQ